MSEYNKSEYCLELWPALASEADNHGESFLSLYELPNELKTDDLGGFCCWKFYHYDTYDTGLRAGDKALRLPCKVLTETYYRCSRNNFEDLKNYVFKYAFVGEHHVYGTNDAELKHLKDCLKSSEIVEDCSGILECNFDFYSSGVTFGEPLNQDDFDRFRAIFNKEMDEAWDRCVQLKLNKDVDNFLLFCDNSGVSYDELEMSF